MFLRPVVTMCLLAAPLLRAADSTLLDLMMPGTKVVIGVRLGALVNSPLAKSIADQVQSGNTQWHQLIGAVGFDPLHDVDEVLIASTGQGKNPPTLIMARGRFGVVRTLPGIVEYHGAALLPAQKKDNSVIALLDDSTVVAGDLGAVQAAIDRQGSHPIQPAGLIQRVTSLAGRYDIYGFGTIPADVTTENGVPPAVKGIDRFQFGITVSRGFELSAEVHARTAKDAQGMSQALQMLTAMISQQQGGSDLAKKLQMGMDGNTLKISLVVSEEEVRKAIEAQAALRRARGADPSPAGRPAGFAQPGPAPAAPQRDPRFSEDTVMVITGSDVDGGTIVVKKP